MARAKTAPQRKKQRKTVRKKKQNWWSSLLVKRLIFAFLLLAFVVFSVGVLTYVVFFRIVVAAELEPSDKNGVVFEEPLLPTVKIERDKIPHSADVRRCAIIVDDMGYQREIGKQLITLPLNLSFSFLPHAPYTQELEKMAYRLGKTVLLHQPMQPKDSSWDPGPGALYVEDLQHQHAIFLENIHLVPHAVGVNNHMGSLYTENRVAMNLLMDVITSEKLFFVDSFTTPNSLGFKLAQEKGIRSARRHIFLDNVEQVDAICAQMKELIDITLHQGEAIGIAHPHQATLTALMTCANYDSVVQFVGVNKLLK